MYGAPLPSHQQSCPNKEMGAYQSRPLWPLSHLFFADDLLILGSCSPAQVALVGDILAQFSASSGLKVNSAKTSAYFSRNVDPREATSICQALGFQKTNHLGRYLGVPMLHDRVTKDTYLYLVDRVRSKLTGWKANSLSLAGRLTLAQSALATIPYYAMQSTKLPLATVNAIDRLVRNFVWGSTAHHRGTPLVKWSTMCQPKAHGGCGLKDLEAQNSAFLLKLAFKLHTEASPLWVQVLRGKYRWSAEAGSSPYTRHVSHLWRNLLAVLPDLELGLGWAIGNGMGLKFWTDNWVAPFGPLIHLSFSPILDNMATTPLLDYVSDSGAWKWRDFSHLLPSNVLAAIAALPTPTVAAPPPSRIWTPGVSGNFTVSTAYTFLKEDDWHDRSNLWSLAWKWPGPQRIRTFLWLALGGRLMTNTERARRHITADDTCPTCHCGPEDVLHVLRDCTLARGCWQLILPPSSLATFQATPGTSWLAHNLRQDRNSAQWQTLFGIICWKLWTSRNRLLFAQEPSHPSCLVNEALALQHQISIAPTGIT